MERRLRAIVMAGSCDARNAWHRSCFFSVSSGCFFVSSLSPRLLALPFYDPSSIILLFTLSLGGSSASHDPCDTLNFFISNLSQF